VAELVRPLEIPGDPTRGLLLLTLELAVPMWIELVRELPAEAKVERCRQLVDVIASRGDVLMFRTPARPRSPHEGDRTGTAGVFNALAETLGILAHAPGGVTFSGRHWEAAPPG
jgi:hypothetical protein